MEVLTQLACIKDMYEKESISPSELISHLQNGTISSRRSFVFKKDHKYVVLRHKESGNILYFMVYDCLDADFDFLAEYARSLCASDKALTDTEDTDLYDCIGHGTFALLKIREDNVLTLFYLKGYRAEERSHYLDALRDEVRQELANLFDMKVQIQFDLRAFSTPQGKSVVL